VTQPRSTGGIAALAAVLLLGVLALAGRANAYVYWTTGEGDPGHIGRADNNGTHSNPKFIRDGGIGPDAVTTDSRHVYWIQSGDIGRAKLDGTKVDQGFIRHADGHDGDVRDLVAAHGYIYWSIGEGYHDQQASIARARADGSQVELGFIPFEEPLKYSTPTELAIAGDYIYWSNAYKKSTIGRAKLDGTEVEQDFIAGGATDPYTPRLHNPFGLAANDDFIYWTDRGTKSIARAATDGSDVELEFIPDVGRYVSSLALDDDYLYWPGSNHTLVRADLDGSNIKTLITHGFPGGAIFVDRLGP
jgi:virginiamycin B lyase